MGDVLPLEPRSASLPPVTPEEFNLIIAGLRQLPHIVSDDLIRKLREHVRAQVGG
jgi:hypothetical protein